RRALVLRLLVFFDIGEATLGRGVTPVQTARALASVGPDAGPSERRFNRAGSPNRCGEMGRPWLRAAGASGSRRGAHSEHRAPAPIGSSECTGRSQLTLTELCCRATTPCLNGHGTRS